MAFKRIDEVLEIVELAARAKDKVKTYSLGMKQRLGIAAALLNNPRIIFLDEPTNGLDPQGTVDMRNLILRLGQNGHTIFLSSHLLYEVEHLCSEVAIVNKGNLLVQGNVQQLLQGRSKVTMEVNPVNTAINVLTHSLGEVVTSVGVSQLETSMSAERVPEAVQALVDAGVKIYSVAPQKASLEDYFLSVTGGSDEKTTIVPAATPEMVAA